MRARIFSSAMCVTYGFNFGRRSVTSVSIIIAVAVAVVGAVVAVVGGVQFAANEAYSFHSN